MCPRRGSRTTNGKIAHQTEEAEAYPPASPAVMRLSSADQALALGASGTSQATQIKRTPCIIHAPRELSSPYPEALRWCSRTPRLSNLAFPMRLSVTETHGTRQVLVDVHALNARCPTALRWIRRDKHVRASGAIQATLRRGARRAFDMDNSSSPSVNELLGKHHRYSGNLAIQSPLVASASAY